MACELFVRFSSPSRMEGDPRRGGAITRPLTRVAHDLERRGGRGRCTAESSAAARRRRLARLPIATIRRRARGRTVPNTDQGCTAR